MAKPNAKTTKRKAAFAALPPKVKYPEENKTEYVHDPMGVICRINGTANGENEVANYVYAEVFAQEPAQPCPDPQFGLPYADVDPVTGVFNLDLQVFCEAGEINLTKWLRVYAEFAPIGMGPPRYRCTDVPFTPVSGACPTAGAGAAQRQTSQIAKSQLRHAESAIAIGRESADFGYVVFAHLSVSSFQRGTRILEGQTKTQGGTQRRIKVFARDVAWQHDNRAASAIYSPRGTGVAAPSPAQNSPSWLLPGAPKHGIFLWQQPTVAGHPPIVHGIWATNLLNAQEISFDSRADIYAQVNDLKSPSAYADNSGGFTLVVKELS